MAGRNTLELLHDILAEIVQVSRLIERHQYEDFYRDEQVCAKVTCCIRALGEKERLIPTIVRVKYALVPWTEPGALDGAIARADPAGRSGLVWEICTGTLPRIRLQIEDLFDEMRKQDRPFPSPRVATAFSILQTSPNAYWTAGPTY